MHVFSLATTLSLDPNPNPNPFWNWNWNWNWGLQFLITAFILGLGILHFLRSTASNFLLLQPNSTSSTSTSSFSVNSSSSSSSSSTNTMAATRNKCALCNSSANKHCAACKIVFYCSFDCQSNHWKSNHRMECQSVGKVKPQQQMVAKRSTGIALVPSIGPDKIQKVVDKVLFPYDEFVKLYNWDKEIFPPCGLLNCGNSCFANVVLQCLVHTRPLLEYLLGKGHRRYCKRDGWCFLCELEFFMTSVSKTPQPFSPMNILSRLRSIGGNLGCGDQEDAHEFMRLSIGAMQSVCLDEHGGEKVIDPKSQETTLIQHIFGGHLRSQVICTTCNQVSNQYENMMDLTVEIQGDATSLQECLDQFTSKEWLHGENKYRCDGCKDYVSAWKRLTIHQAPNVLTIALKRFQSGRFGKINKKISFPEILELSPFMSEERDGMDIYKLYAVIVHVDMLNASFFGHYICYTKGFRGDWYRIDDCKVTRVELDEVLSQGAYMLLYRRIIPRPQCLKTFKPGTSEQKNSEKVSTVGKLSSTSTILTADSSSYSEPSSSIDRDIEESCVSGQPGVVEVVKNENGPCSSAFSDIPSSSSVGVNKQDSKIYVNGSLYATGEPQGHRSDDDNTRCCTDQTSVGERLADDVETPSAELNDCVSNGATKELIIDEKLPLGAD